jgi:Ca-activated chloride channel family protein
VNLTFLAPVWLLLLPCALLPFWQRSPALPISSLQPLTGLATGWRVRLHQWHRPLQMLVLALIIVALAAPARQRQETTVIRNGLNLMLALDISASMRADDIRPDRITVARNAAADFIERRQSDRIGVLLFSGAPYLLSPPVVEAAPVIDRLRQVAADETGSGTALGDALAAAAARLDLPGPGGRAVILLTDGTSNRGRLTPLAAARAAASLGIRVYTIGFGLRSGTLLPVIPGGQSQRVVLDEAPLQQIADLTGGRYFRATDSASLDAVYRQIDTLEKEPLATRTRLDTRPLAPLLLQAAAAFLLLELLLFRLWLRRIP